jgi:hypothetical protein
VQSVESPVLLSPLRIRPVASTVDVTVIWTVIGTFVGFVTRIVLPGAGLALVSDTSAVPVGPGPIGVIDADELPHATWATSSAAHAARGHSLRSDGADISLAHEVQMPGQRHEATETQPRKRETTRPRNHETR